MSAQTSSNDDRTGAYQEAAIELGKGIAMGAVPFLGQAIDVYDTIESAVLLYKSDTPGAKEDAQFDLLLAVIGWIPGAGDGLKKSMRIVNRNPQRFAPVLFDLLRFVLQECGIKTSPEELLSRIFNAGKLRAEMDDIISAIRSSSVYKGSPGWVQTAVVTVLATARDNMPAMLGIVEKRLIKWKGMQRNSSAASSGSSHPRRGEKPANRDSTVGTQGKDGASGTHSNRVESSRVGVQAPSSILNEGLGVSGEHIADYICAVEFGWGKDWDGHDKGADGKWLEGLPSATKTGKLSSGGSPKARHVLYKLSDGANGTGIDAVWRAKPANNGGEKFAIVEAKASREEDAPKFMRRANNTRKPGIASKLGESGLSGVTRIADASQLLEPIEGTPEAGASKPSTSMRTGKNKPQASSRSPAPSAKIKEVLVQMSSQWITQNLNKAVAGRALAAQVLASYSRHLFYSPLYHSSASPKDHAEARLQNLAESAHRTHKAFHYNETEVKAAVNKRKKSLAKRYGARDSLKLEA
ncbi:hypothetical protein [Pseudomonas fluorescens]|uniref:Uncharacterized protein n=1 Tax=Pseudomonas fluorescens TaxID=294 RepID=A0A423ML07_PSEFL|nr:hypothetical protein [Pseudomonas fluorescens]RON85206.1 hypothetical protein BK670_04710 [Pseudomonas fluorescens]